jgi:hypothetical protein
MVTRPAAGGRKRPKRREEIAQNFLMKGSLVIDESS